MNGGTGVRSDTTVPLSKSLLLSCLAPLLLYTETKEIYCLKMTNIVYYKQAAVTEFYQNIV
jgi:hypothetical protein